MDIKTQYNQIGRKYLEGQQSFFSEREDWGRKLMVEFMGNPRGKTVLDIGCGYGIDVLEYKKLGTSRVIGIDPSEFMLEEAKKRVGAVAELLLGEYENIPCPNHSIDIAAGRYSMHYLKSFDKAYQEILRVLKPNGMLVLLLPHPTGDGFLQREKDTYGVDIVSCDLYDGKVTVKYPLHTLAQYFSDFFLENFALEHFREFVQEEVSLGTLVPTAMVFKATIRT